MTPVRRVGLDEGAVVVEDRRERGGALGWPGREKPGYVAGLDLGKTPTMSAVRFLDFIGCLYGLKLL